MRFYAERPARLCLQVVVDVAALAWLAAFGWLAIAAYELLLTLAAPGSALVRAGNAIGGTFDEAARSAGSIPFMGDEMADALSGGRTAGDSIAAAGQQQIDAVGTLATGSCVAVLLLGVLPLVVGWLPPRLRYARAARAATRIRDLDTDLLALRALTHQPVGRLLRESDDPSAAWRRDDRQVIHRLAALELRRLGLRPPRRPLSLER